MFFKIHLIKTSEYKAEYLKEIYYLLSSFKGPMEFKISNSETDRNKVKNNTFRNKQKETDNSIFLLSWEELFSHCRTYRKKNRIDKKDFVFLITNRYNMLNWFSLCNEVRNGFIHADGWEQYNVKTHHKYPVAYQIIENVLQVLMDIDLDNKDEDCIHYQSRGCINDFCLDKKQVILKLRTADICETCFKRLKSRNIPPQLLDQIFQILEGLRTQFLYKKDINRITGSYSLVADKNYRLLIPQLGNMELLPEPLFRTLYIVLLKNPDGIKLNDLVSYKNQLIEIYQKLQPNISKMECIKRIEDLINPVGGSFSQKKAKINRGLINKLGDTISKSFLIKGKRCEPFRINLSPEQTDIRF